VVCLAPPAEEEIVRPRLQSGAYARPLNFTVRSRYGTVRLRTLVDRSRAALAHLQAAR